MNVIKITIESAITQCFDVNQLFLEEEFRSQNQDALYETLRERGLACRRRYQSGIQTRD